MEAMNKSVTAVKDVVSKKNFWIGVIASGVVFGTVGFGIASWIHAEEKKLLGMGGNKPTPTPAKAETPAPAVTVNVATPPAAPKA